MEPGRATRSGGLLASNRPQAYLEGQNLTWLCETCWIANLNRRGVPSPTGWAMADKVQDYATWQSGRSSDPRASALPPLPSHWPLDYGCSPLARDTRALGDLLM
eukprot:690207-Pyramimonas_sp.AAC.1